MLAVELFEPSKHYATICGWWTAQSWPPMPLTHLPQTGVVVMRDGKPAAAGWLIRTDTAICWLEWIVADPGVRHDERSEVLSVLISSCRVLAQVMGFQSIFSSSASESLSKRLDDHGIKATDRRVTHHACELRR
jgi:hypothetical protein